jgi:hypothetical protein
MNELLNPAVIGDLAERLSAVAPERDLGPLQKITAAQLEPLSLRERTDLVSAALIEALAANYSAAAAIVRGLLVDRRSGAGGCGPSARRWRPSPSSTAARPPSTTPSR